MYKMFSKVVLLSLFEVFSISCNQTDLSTNFTITPDIPNSIEIVINDMKLPHEGRMHGVPDSFGWALMPEVSAGNYPGDFHAMTSWGQLYVDAGGNPARNTRVQIRDIKAYVLGKRDNRWHLLQSSRLVEGGAYREDYFIGENRPADIHSESDGSISVVAGGGYNYHFWPSTGRAGIDTADIAGVFTAVRARLILDFPIPDDRINARYLLDMGGDYWLSTTALWDREKTNKGIGLGRFKYVKTGWQSFNMSTLSEEEIRLSPPPLDE